MHALKHLKTCFSHFVEEPCHVRFEGEDNDEKILLLLRRHIATNIPWMLLASLMLFFPQFLVWAFNYGGVNITALVPFTYRVILTLFWYLITFVFVFESYLIWYFNVYIITNKRVVDIDFYGILSREVSDASIRQIQDVTYNVRGIFAILFNFGNVLIQTAGEIEQLEFEYVSHPARVQNLISDLSAGVRKGNTK